MANKIYIKLDSNSRVIAVDADWNIKDLTGWIKIDEGTGEKYYLAQSHYLDKSLINMNGTHNYIYKNNAVRETTEAERQAELASSPAPQPTPLEQAQADIQKNESLTLLYSALLKDNQDDLLSEIEDLKSQIAILKGVQ